MTTNYFTIQAPTGKTQEIDLPIDSVVYFSIKKNDYPNIWMPMLFLNETWTGINGVTWYNSSNQAYPQVWVSNDMAITRFYTGYVPFESTFNAQVKGFTKTIGGEEPLSVSRTTYQTSNGDTFYTDTWIQSINIDAWLSIEGGQAVSQTENIQHYIVRDSNLNQIGGYSRTTIKISVVVSGRIRQVVGTYNYCPITSYGTLPVKPNDTSAPSYNKPEYDASEATQTGTTETVSITDYYTYTPATPIIIPMHFSCTEKSYSYIYF